MAPEDSSPSELEKRIDRLETELVAARQVIADKVVAHSMEVGNLAPNSIFDRHGAMGIIFAIFVQTAGAIWWAAGLSAEVKDLRASAIERERAITELARVVTDNNDRLTRVQAVQEQVVKILDRHTFDTERERQPPLPDRNPQRN